MEISRERRREIIAALRKGTVPQRGLDFFAVGLGRFEPVISEELADVAQGGSGVQGGPWRLRLRQDVFRSLGPGVSQEEGLRHRRGADLRDRDPTPSPGNGLPAGDGAAFDGRLLPWGLPLDHRRLVLWPGGRCLGRREHRPQRRGRRSPSGPTSLLEQRLVEITRATPQFAAALRCVPDGSDGRMTTPPPKAWRVGWPGNPMSPHRSRGVAGIKGDVDHFAALSFLRGLLLILKDSGYSGLVLVLDEIETLQTSPRRREREGTRMPCGS